MRKKKTTTRRGDRAGAATAIGLMILGPSALAIDSGPALARLAPQAYEIAPGPMADALSRLADESGAHLVFDAAIARHVFTRGVHGKRTLEEALDELLTGTRLTYRFDPGQQSISIILARSDRTIDDASPNGAEQLPTIDIGASQTPSTRPGHMATRYNPPNGKLQLDVNDAIASRLQLTPRQTPSSVTVIDGATMRARGASTTSEAASRAPGVKAGQNPGGAGTFCMRGFCSPQITALFNGITVQYDWVSARPLDTWIIDRIEVLGGPASYMWGVSAVGGAINFVSKTANREQKGHEFFAEGGMWGNRRVAYGYNGQIDDTPNWFQLAAAYKGSDGYVEHTPHNSGVVSASLLSDFSADLSNTIAAEFHTEERDAYWGSPLLNPVIGGVMYPEGTAGLPVHDGKIVPGTRFKQYNAADPIFDHQVVWVRDTTDYRLSDQTQFKNMFYFYRADRQFENVEVYRANSVTRVIDGVSYAPNTAVDRSSAYYVRHMQSLVGNRTEALHEDSVFGLPTKLAAGVDVSWNTMTRNTSLGSLGYINSVPPLSYSVGTFGQTVFPDGTTPSGGLPNAQDHLRTIALFAENRTSLLPQLSLLTSVRWEDIDLAHTNFRTPTPPTADNPFGDPAYFHRDWQPITWRAGLMYDVAKDMNVYVTYSTAADPAANLLLANNAGGLRDFNLTRGRQIEGGAKLDFLDGRGSMTIAGYFIERKNLTTRDPSNPQNQIPVGQQSSSGIEVNAGLQVTPELSLQGNLAWTNPKYDKFNESVTLLGQTVSASRAGNRPINVPRWLANGFLTWKFLPDWEWYFAGRFEGDRFGDTGNTIRIPAYTTFDAALSWTPPLDPKLPRVTLTARVKNLADTQWVEWARAPAPTFIIGQPRTFEMSLYTKF